jgi:hypothetical protein
MTLMHKTHREPFIFAGNEANLLFNFGNYSNKADVMAAVDRIVWLDQNTNITGGLRVARIQAFNADNKAETCGTPRRICIVFLITDGSPTRDAELLEGEANTIKNNGIRLIAVGVTTQVTNFVSTLSTTEMDLQSAHNIIEC